MDGEGGKGGNGKGARRCFECNEEGHIAAECAIRKNRVAKAGPERLPKGKAKGKGVLAWKQWEGPLRWHPQPAGGKGPGAHALWGSPHQLSLVGAMPGPGAQMFQALFDGPSRLSSYTVKAVKNIKKVHFAEAGALPQLLGVSGGMDLQTDELRRAKRHGLDRRIEFGN